MRQTLRGGTTTERPTFEIGEGIALSCDDLDPFFAGRHRLLAYRYLHPYAYRFACDHHQTAQNQGSSRRNGGCPCCSPRNSYS